MMMLMLIGVGMEAATRSVAWEGAQNMGTTWKKDVQVPSYAFLDLMEGDVIELHFTASVTSPQVQLWANGYGRKLVDSDPLTGTTYSYGVTADNVGDLRKGLTVKGQGFTLLRVEIVSESVRDDDVYVADGTFSVRGTEIIDANGQPFMMRGVNYSYAWQHGHESTVIPAAKRIGANCIRIQLGTGAVYPKVTAPELEYLIKLCERNRLIAIFNTHDETGDDNIASLRNAVDYWVEMKDVLNAHTSTVIVNISNEWFGSWDADGWAEGYRMAIPRIREGGVRNMLMVDCGGYGQYPESIFRHGKSIAALDPDANMVYSMHFYDCAGANDALVKSNIDKALALGVPAVIGEFAYKHKGMPVAWQMILDYCAEKSMGYLGWSWTGNGGGTEDCDMFAGYDESVYKENGRCIVDGRNGIRETSKECTVYDKDFSGIDSPTVEERGFDFDAPYEIYTITGMKVSSMSPGNMYILRQNGKAMKYIQR